MSQIPTSQVAAMSTAAGSNPPCDDGSCAPITEIASTVTTSMLSSSKYEGGRPSGER